MTSFHDADHAMEKYIFFVQTCLKRWKVFDLEEAAQVADAVLSRHITYSPPYKTVFSVEHFKTKQHLEFTIKYTKFNILALIMMNK